jgi:phosphatidylinositol alpha-1,6-mannosyltransferase
MRRHLLVTNDFPPKVGGIQNYLWELWSRLDPQSFSVLTASSDPAAAEFDQEQARRGVKIERVPSKVLFFPTPAVRRRIEVAAAAMGAELIILDPAFPLGLVASKLSLPTVPLLHGAEVAIPGRLPVTRSAMRRLLGASAGAIAAGPYPEAEARRALDSAMPTVLQVPPGVDTNRFVPLEEAEKPEVRARLGLPTSGPLVVSVSRLVPRKGMDTLIRAAARLRGAIPDLTVAIGGTGRDAERLDTLVAKTGAPVRLLGRVADEDLPGLIGAADVFVMDCRTRWLGLEQEGFGIVFLEAAAAGVPQIAGRSGGASDAVLNGETGLILKDSSDAGELAAAIEQLLSDPERARAMGRAGRERAVASFDYGVLARRLGNALGGTWPLGD